MDNAPNSRVILNANRGMSNVIEEKVINTDLRRVTNDIFKILKHHYGPYSGFAAKDDGQPLNETVFTKDGIGIVRAIQYASPQEEWVRKTIAYIGSRMEASVGDGTTSAMMFTCAMLKHMSEHIDEIKPISYNRFRNAFNQFIHLVQHRIKRDYTLSPFISLGPVKEGETDKDRQLDKSRVYQIVRNQVYTSSHGDGKLADALANMYANVPKEQWEHMVYERCRYETDKDYEVIASEGQYQMHAEVFTSSMLNKDLCTWFEKPHCTVLIINDSLRMDSPAWPIIMEKIDNSTAETPVVLVCHMQMDTNTYQELNEKINICDRAGTPFAVFTSKPDNPKVNDYVALQAIIGMDVTKMIHGEVTVAEDVTVKYKNKKLSFDNLVPIPEGYTDNERHQMTDGQHSQFTDIVETWKKQSEWYAKQGTNRQEWELANFFNKMYIKLRYNKVYSVTVGGKAYDNVAFVDVLDDAIRAASRALTNGATFGNNRALYITSERILESKGGAVTPLVKWFAKRVIETLDDIAEVVLERAHPKNWYAPWVKDTFVRWWFYHTVDLLHYDRSRASGNCFSMNWDKDDVFRYIDRVNVDMEQLFKDGMICQPSNSDIIMLERFGEVALKFILTERIIIKDGVYVDKKRK